MNCGSGIVVLMLALRTARAVLLLVAVGAVAVLVARLVPAAPRDLLPALAPSLILVLVTVIGSLVSAYAVRNLEGQTRLGRFALLEVVAVGGLSLAVLSPTLPLLATGWTVGGLAVAALVAHAGTAESRAAASAVRLRLLAGDALLWLAVLVVGMQLGTWDVAEVEAAVAAGPATWVTLAAVLVILAGASRSALVPAHRWLPETAAAPSPVSALLHAGLVNGVGLLALLLWPLVTASMAARVLLLVLAVGTALLATAQMRTRPDVKGRLAGSTSAQMGYLGVQVALGLPGAVLAHMIGHGLWKASLFLGAGGAVARERAAARHLTPTTGARSRAVDMTIGVGVVGLLSWVPGPWGAGLVVGPAALVPVGVAALATVLALGSVRRRGTGRVTSVRAVGLVLLAVSAYVLGLRALTSAVEVTVPLATPGWGEPGSLAVLLLAVALAGIVVVAWHADRALRAGRGASVVTRVARTALPPATLAEALSPRGEVGQPHATPVVDAAVEQARTAVRVAADVVAPLWPLDAFVASSPLAELESLTIDDALAVAARSWGSATGPDGESLARARDAGRISDADIDRALADAGLAPGPELTAAGRTRSRIEVARRLVLDPAPAAAAAAVGAGLSPLDLLAASGEAGARAARRSRAVAHHVMAHACGSTGWPRTSTPWNALRADEPGLDSALRVRGAARVVSSLPVRADVAIAVLFDRLDVPLPERIPLVSRLLGRDPGWPAHLSWRARTGLPLISGHAVANPATSSSGDATDDLLELVAVRLAVEVLVIEAYAPSLLGTDGSWTSLPWVAAPEEHARHSAVLRRGAAALGVALRDLSREQAAAVADLVRDVDALGVDRVRRAVWEESWRAPVVTALARRARELTAHGHLLGKAPAGGTPKAQVITCIDVRSERLRRQLEATGSWETFGAAGFFGLPLLHTSPSGATSERCPAILRPVVTVHETRAGGTTPPPFVDALESAHAVEQQPVAPFALAEAAGWVVGPASLARTAAPAAWDRATAPARSGVETKGTLHVLSGGTSAGGFELDDATDLAAGFLRSTGLLDLAPLVMLCGHAGHAANNPHVAAYDCGACGGRSGDVSARAMASVLNDPGVRARLVARDIVVPSGTWFVAALHDTTRDRVEVLDEHLVPDGVRGLLDALLASLAAATDAVVVERYGALPAAPAARSRAQQRRHLDRRAVDWAQPRPEWGLAGNAAIVIGPRQLTSALDLDGRSFLQSYRADLDPDGSALESLLTGPLVVAQWINLQYWCSTVDPLHFGAGDKTTHNVLGGADGSAQPLSGVVTGARGDLRIGLPWQAVSAYAPVDARWVQGAPHHEPLRLLAVVCADIEAIDAVLARHPHVARLVMGEWLSLASVDPVTGLLSRFDPASGWAPTELDSGGLVDLAADAEPVRS